MRWSSKQQGREEERVERRGEGRGEEEVVDEGMREKKTEGWKEKNEWSERVTEKGREHSFLRAVISCSKSFLLNNASCVVANGSQSH